LRKFTVLEGGGRRALEPVDHEAAIARLLSINQAFRDADGRLAFSLSRAIRLIAIVRGGDKTIELLQQEIDLLRGNTSHE